MEEQKEFYRVPEANFTELQNRIGKLNKRAVKLGCDLITLTQVGEEEVPVYAKDFDGLTLRDRITGNPVISHYRKVLHIKIEGQAPKLAGWEFVAVIEPIWDDKGNMLGNILRNVPGASAVPEQYRKAESFCDHCKTKRIRHQTFVLLNEAGDSKQVGRNCLRDFLGHTDPERYCSLAEMLMEAQELAMGSEDEEFFGAGVRHVDRFEAEEILALTACSVRTVGWRSNKTAREFGTISTSGEVSNWIYAKPHERSKWKFPLIPSDEDKATAKEVVEWLSKLQDRPNLNDYLYNLSLLGQGARFTTKNFGLACSAIPTYLREMEQEINRRKRFEDDKNSQYVSEVGKRDKLTLILVYTRDWEGEFGVTHFYKFKDEAGNVVVWFSSSVYWNPATKQDINVGDTIVVNATVKRHEEREGVKQTIVTRCTEWKSKEQKKAEAAARKAERAAAQQPEEGQ